MEEEEGEYVLSDEEYSTLCELAQSGQTERVKEFLRKGLNNRKIGVRTFAADPTSSSVVRRVSPITLAARFGRLDTVKYFLKKFPKAVDLNPGANEYFQGPKLNKELRHDLPLYWASLNGHLEVSRLMVSAGALVDLPNCMLATPLHAAASNGHLKVMEFLVGQAGAKVNSVDLLGYSPLLAAVSGGHLKAVLYLLGKKADVNQRTAEGYSVMHIACEGGHFAVVKALLNHGVPIAFSESNPFEEEYIPCPLFLAAANGHKELTTELICHPDCTPSVIADGLLLLGVGLLKIRSKYFSRDDRMLSVRLHWEQALAIRKAEKISTMSVQIPEYGNRSEINNSDALNGVCSLPFEAYYQCLLIMERCLGSGSKIISASTLGGDQLQVPTSGVPSDMCINRIMEMTVSSWQKDIEREIFHSPSKFQLLLENYLQRYSSRRYEWIQDFECVQIGMKALDVLNTLQKTHKCEAGSLQTVLSFLIYLIAAWLCYDYEMQQSDHANADVEVDSYVGPQMCEELGRKLVSEYLFPAEGTTLLHIVLSDNRIIQHIWESMRYGTIVTQQSPPKFVVVVVRALLRWGSDAAINTPDWNGQRPLHLAVGLAGQFKYQLDVISPLVMHGAHLDYVNREGKTPLDLCRGHREAAAVRELLSPSGPLPLTCLATHVILREQIPYLAMRIPPRIKAIIQAHDGNSLK